MGGRAPDGRIDRREVVLRGDRVVGVEDVVDRRAEGRAHPSSQNREEDDERHADHQRRGRRSRPNRVPLGVASGQPPGRAAQALRGPAEYARERSHEARREPCDAGEEEQDADAEQGQHSRGPEPALEEREREERDPERRGGEREVRLQPGEPAGRQLCALADGGDRRHAGRPERGPEAREQRDTDPDDERDDERPRRVDEPGLRQVDPERHEQAVEQPCQPEAREETDERRKRADNQRLDDHGAEHLPARRPDCPQRRELARPLRDRDRERVRDHERADEERDPAEDEQDVPEDVQEGIRVRGVDLHLLRRGAHIDGRRQH